MTLFGVTLPKRWGPRTFLRTRRNHLGIPVLQAPWRSQVSDHRCPGVGTYRTGLSGKQPSIPLPDCLNISRKAIPLPQSYLSKPGSIWCGLSCRRLDAMVGGSTPRPDVYPQFPNMADM